MTDLPCDDPDCWCCNYQDRHECAGPFHGVPGDRWTCEECGLEWTCRSPDEIPERLKKFPGLLAAPWWSSSKPAEGKKK